MPVDRPSRSHEGDDAEPRLEWTRRPADLAPKGEPISIEFGVADDSGEGSEPSPEVLKASKASSDEGAEESAPEISEEERGAEAERERRLAYRESLGGEPLKLGEGALLDARMRIEDRALETDDPKVQTITRGVHYSEAAWGHIESGGKNADGTSDDLAVEARELLRLAGHPRVAVRDHVEMKLAAQMVRDEIPYMTVAINNEVCFRRGDQVSPTSCRALVPEVLPQGYALRVYQLGSDEPEVLLEGRAEPRQ